MSETGTEAGAPKTPAAPDNPPAASAPETEASAYYKEEPDPPSSGYHSLAQMLFDRVKKTPDADAFYFPIETPSGDEWKTIRWSEVGERARTIAAGLRALGVEDEQRVAILASTRIEWILADLGILSAGAATTTIYPSSTGEEAAFILSDSNSVVLFAEDAKQVEKMVAERANIPQVGRVVTFDGTSGHDGWVISLEELEELGRKRREEQPEEVDAIASRIEPSWLATLIYTSGTTGKPKGVELLHDCWIYEGEAVDSLGLLSGDDKQYLWLPLSHSFGKLMQVLILMIGIPTAVDGRIPKLVDNLAVVKPTFMAAAPRIFEKVYNKVLTDTKAAGGIKWSIFRWSVGIGKQVSQLRQKGKEPGGLLGLQYSIADRLVFSKLRARFGGRLRFFISGSAPLSREMAEFFHAADILILEGYGLTESSAATFVNRLDAWRFGTVGKPVPGTEVKIAKDDGEILIRGRGIMRGYHGLPEVNAETLEGRWLRTGDIGELDPDGFLRITDRKKDLIKTSGGKYVAPQHLESKVKAECPYLSQVLVHGNARNFCTALVTVDEESIKKWAKDEGIEGSYVELTRHPRVHQMVQEAVDRVNANLARYETVKKFAILERDFTVETGEMTPSMKVKRKAVEKQYADLLDSFYEGALHDV